MDSELITLLIGIPLGLAAAYAGYRYLLRYGGAPRFMKEPIPVEWWPMVERHLPIARGLQPDARERLLRYVQLFVTQKRFEGCDGVIVTEEMRVVLAAQACLLIVNIGGPCYPRVSTVLVYPGAFVGRRFHWSGGADGEGDSDTLLGEAWRDGVVVVGWDEAKGDAVNQTDGDNVVMHEFAHQLDFEDGGSDGVPLLDGRVSYRAWATTLGRAYGRLRAAIEKESGTGALKAYGATNPAEFFAVATEAFFQKPVQLEAEHPELYRLLSAYYRLDPKSLAGA